MNIDKIESELHSILGPAVEIDGEAGLVRNGCTEVRRIGYATNLTPETVLGARRANIDLLITHHDAWGFIYGMNNECHSALSEWGIAHFYAHLPLDAAHFGTAASLIRGLDGTTGSGIAKHGDYPQGMVGHFGKPMAIADIAGKLKQLIEEDIKVWPCGPAKIESFGVVTGGGSLTEYVKDAADAGCQLYITGEQSLYLIQYCMSIGMNLIVGSHTYTELPGVSALANMLQERHPSLEVLRVTESHYESLPNKAVQWTPLRGATDL